MTKLQRVSKLLSDGAYHTIKELHRVGGAEATRRVRELRASGQNIEKVNVGRNEFYYRRILVA